MFWPVPGVKYCWKWIFWHSTLQKIIVKTAYLVALTVKETLCGVVFMQNFASGPRWLPGVVVDSQARPKWVDWWLNSLMPRRPQSDLHNQLDSRTCSRRHWWWSDSYWTAWGSTTRGSPWTCTYSTTTRITNQDHQPPLQYGWSMSNWGILIKERGV